MTLQLVPSTCSLRQSAGAGLELCPGSACALWEDGCLVDRLRLPLRSDIAALLLELRLELETLRRAQA